jgi:hypothetical protein
MPFEAMGVQPDHEPYAPEEAKFVRYLSARDPPFPWASVWVRVAAKRRPLMRFTHQTGMLLLGIWLILTGVIPLLNLGFSGMSVLMSILAIVAGAMILLGR